MQNTPIQWGKSYTFESSDSDLGIMKSKVHSNYYLNVTTPSFERG